MDYIIYGTYNSEVWDAKSSSRGRWDIYPPDNARLIPRFDYFTIPGEDYGGYSGEFTKGHGMDSRLRAKCEGGTITFDNVQPRINMNINFPFDLSPISIGSDITSTLYMMFDIDCGRILSFICTREAANKWIEDANKWIASKNLHKGMIQIYIDPHIMDIPDWYAQKIGL